MNKNVTMIVLSRTPYNPIYIPENCEYLNYASLFSDYDDAVDKMIHTVSQIKTPYYFFCDDDDQVPLVVPTPEDGKGILYGDLIVEHQRGGRIVTTRGYEWESEKHLRFPFLTHKCVSSTEYTLKLSKVIPSKHIWFEFVYHYFLADCFGAQYNPEYVYIWTKYTTGMHVEKPPLRDSSHAWIRANRERVRTLMGV